MPGTPMPWVKPQFFDDDGAPAAGYQLFVYDAGTAVKQNTWSDSALTSLNTNPIVLDSAGRASIFLVAQTHKFILATPTAADPPAGGDQVWSIDDVAAVPFWGLNTAVDPVGTQVEWVTRDSSLQLRAPYAPVTLQNYYVNTGTTSAAITIPAGTLHDGTSALGHIIIEWETDYAVANLSARATIAGTNVDLGVGVNSENARAKYHICVVDNTTLSVDQTVIQQTTAPAGAKAQVALAHSTIGALDLANVAYEIEVGMAAGAYTIRGARGHFMKQVADLLG